MIGFLPEIYPDELVYSWFCRYYVHSGCLTHKMALDDILYKRCNNPSKEFLGHLNPNMQKNIQEIYPIEKLILEHTMFPQYARFIPLERKKQAMYHMAYDFCDVHHLFAVLPRTDTDRYLKYCPVCVKEDREMYGETYWHRLHQIRNMQVCCKHKCMLESSSVTAKSEQTFTFCPAEEYVKSSIPIIAESNLQKFSEFMVSVFNAPIDFEKDIPIKAVLHYGLFNTKYISKKHTTKYTTNLSEDMQEYYSNIGLSDIASIYQIQRVLMGERFDFSVVCQIAYFIGMSIKDLTTPAISRTQIEKEEETHYRKGKTHIDWEIYDDELSPVLEQALRNVYYGEINNNGRPEKVSEKMVYKEFGLDKHRLKNMPKCREILEKYSECYEEFWARRIVWAYSKLKEERKDNPFYWTDIRQMSGVKKKNIEKVIPFISKYVDKGTSTIAENEILSLLMS